MMMEKSPVKPYKLWCGMLIILLLAGCAAQESILHLQPGRQQEAASSAAARPLVQLNLFTEERSGDSGVIGGHFFRADRQLLVVEEGETARALRRMIGRQLAEKNIPYIDGEELPIGFGQSAPAVPMVVEGRISRLWLEVKSGVTHSNYEIKLDVVSQLHLLSEKKVISRGVQIEEEMIKFSSQPGEMEKFLDDSLEKAAHQIVLKIGEHINTVKFKNSHGSWQ
jgi:hypothetical protein